ncbi:MAG: thioredoxin-like domain-containing protein [Candidatus Brocadiales bacterium]
MRCYRLSLLILLLIFLAVPLGTLSGDTKTQASPTKMKAPEFPEGMEWLNTGGEPIRLADLRGKMVLLDFWTYCCINCMHVIPDLKKLEAKYPNNLVVIGVHSAKFINEQVTENIKQAILRYEIEHPVVNDSEFSIWTTYGIRAWPTLVLIDPDGNVVAGYSGEGNYEEIDRQIDGYVKWFRQKNQLNETPFTTTLEKQRLGPSPLSFPGKILADPNNDKLFISDSGHNRIVITRRDGQVLDIAGSGEAGARDGSFENASFFHPQGMALDGDTLYVADTENHLIRRLDLKSRTVTTIAGTGEQGSFLSMGGLGTKASLSSPWDLTLIRNKLYIAMAGVHQIWVMDLTNTLIKPYAGSGREGIRDGSLDSSEWAQPSGITFSGHKLYVADSETSSVREIDIDANWVRTIVGRGLFIFGDKDGKKNDVRLQHPLGVLHHNGLLYVADTYNHKIKAVDPAESTSKTFLGSGSPGRKDGEGSEFYEPGGLDFVDGRFFIADTNNHAIRVADLAGNVTTLTLEGL